MSGWDEEDDGTGRRRRIGIMLGAAVVFAIGVMIIGVMTTGSPLFMSRSWTTEDVDRALREHPEAGALYRAVKADYPTEYRDFLIQAAGDATRNGGGALERHARGFVRRLTAYHYVNVTKAPNPHLIDLARQNVQLLRALQSADVRLCADFVSNGNVPADGFPGAADALLIRAETQLIRAARVGASGSRAPRPSPTLAELQTLVTEAGRRSPDAARMLMDEGFARAASPERQCAAGIATYETVACMPPELAATLIIGLLQPPGVPDRPAPGGTVQGGAGQGSSPAGQ